MSLSRDNRREPPQGWCRPSHDRAGLPLVWILSPRDRAERPNNRAEPPIVRAERPDGRNRPFRHQRGCSSGRRQPPDDYPRPPNDRISAGFGPKMPVTAARRLRTDARNLRATERRQEPARRKQTAIGRKQTANRRHRRSVSRDTPSAARFPPPCGFSSPRAGRRPRMIIQITDGIWSALDQPWITTEMVVVEFPPSSSRTVRLTA